MASTYDPAYIDWLMNDTQYSGMPSYEEDVWKDQSSWMTPASKGGNLAMDPEFLITSGLVDPGAFQPITSFDPVDAPGYQLKNRWKQGSAYEQYLAGQFEMGKTANEILADIQRFAANPGDDPIARDVVASLPPFIHYDEQTGQQTVTSQPDMRAVGDELRKFESVINSDPTGYTVDPTTGQPMMPTTEDSPMRLALLKAGIVNMPGEAYDPYSFAPAGAREQDAATMTDFVKANAARAATDIGASTDMAKRDAAQKAYQTWLRRIDPAELTASGLVPPTKEIDPYTLDDWSSKSAPGGGALDPGIARARRIIADHRAADDSGGDFGPIQPEGVTFYKGKGKGKQLDRLQVAQAHGLDMGSRGPATSARPAGQMRGAQALTAAMRRAAGEAQTQVIKNVALQRAAKRTGNDASNAAYYAQRQQAERQALAQQLLAAGRSPYDDEMNRRRAAVFGLGG